MNELTEIRSYQTPLAWVHLRWMEEYRLERLVELHLQNKLEGYLTKQVERAEDQISLLLQAGRTRELAEEEVIGILLAPPREEDPPSWSRELMRQIPEIERSLKI